MPPKRKSDTGSDSGNSTKKAKTAAPRLKKSKRVDWQDNNPTWVMDKPQGEWARKAAERWCLLPPYNMAVSEKNWKAYYEERAALDEVNTPNSDASKPIVSEELGQDTFKLLRKASANVAKVICGSVADEEERKQLSREGGGDNPRSVNSKTRLYSPYGLGTSVDFVYDYHFRMRMTMAGEKFSTLLACTRMAMDCNPKEPRASCAVTKDRNGRQKPEEGAVKVINMSGAKITGTTAANLGDFEEALFGQTGWLSPLKTFQVVAYAGTVGHYHEAYGGQLLSKGGLDKFKLFQEETDGKEFWDRESPLYAQKEEKEGSVQMRLLGLARNSADVEEEEEEDSEE
ncbi:hypothetical protein BDZ89DRAFT_1082289 [Hymenopellis radicata]|nr:hypothetical protein BDZ89DRAFT_1082289 [Hymenopellis radicata]